MTYRTRVCKCRFSGRGEGGREGVTGLVWVPTFFEEKKKKKKKKKNK